MKTFRQFIAEGGEGSGQKGHTTSHDELTKKHSFSHGSQSNYNNKETHHKYHEYNNEGNLEKIHHFFGDRDGRSLKYDHSSAAHRGRHGKSANRMYQDKRFSESLSEGGEGSGQKGHHTDQKPTMRH